MAFTHIDCFSGPGGIYTGLHAAGFETKVAIEFIQSCCETYSANHPEVHMIHSDIRNVTADDSVGVRRATRLSPCDFKGFQRHLQSAYVLVRLIHLP